MSSRIREVAVWMVAILVIAGLGFGASQLFAAQPSACDGYDGTCANPQECHDLCLILYPLNGGAGLCDGNGCCRCAQR